MKTVLVMRHSHAVSENPSYADKERPLTNSGIELLNDTVPELAAWPVQAIIASSAIRTEQTAQRVKAALSDVESFIVRDELYLASTQHYTKCLRELDNDVDCALIVGHNPGIASLIATWSNEHLSVTPATVAVFQWEVESWRDLQPTGNCGQTLEALISQGQRVR